MNVQALLHAGVGGVADRGRQAVARLIDRLIVLVQPQVRRWPAHLAPDAIAAPSSVDPARFFAGAAENLASFNARFPLERDRMLFSAQARVDGRFDLLGYRALEFGSPIDWHYDPVADRSAPLTHWSEIDALDYPALGDSKVIWELSRHQWLCELGQAWRLSGDPRHADAFVDAVTDWMQANRPGIGINWASSLEVSFRLVSWSWALQLFRGAPQLTPSLTVELLAWIRAHSLHVERYLSFYYSPNTHLTGEALGLFHAGVVFPQFPESKRWRRVGMRILLGEIDRQVRADGGHFEQATGYHRYTAEMFLHFLMLARRAGIAVPARAAARTQAMFDFLLDVCRPDRTMPSVGDDDGGTWLRLSHREREDVSGVFSTAAAFFERADYAWAAGGLQPETWWLLGEEGCRRFDALTPAPPSRSPSRLLPKSGYAVMRTNWSETSHQLIADAGPLGCPVSAAHGHADFLSIQVNVDGKAMIVDPGTDRYVQDGWREYFRTTAAHSTVTVDQRSQAEPAGLFAWCDRPEVRIRAWQSDEAHDLFDAEHGGYHRLTDPVTHRRRVLFIKPALWIVVDDLDGAAAHGADVRFQFVPGAGVSAAPGADWWCAVAGGARLWMKTLAAADLDVRIDDGWVSDAYGRREPAPMLSVSTRAQLPLRLITVLRAGDARPDGGCIRRRSERIDEIEACGYRIDITADSLTYQRRID